MRKLLIILFLFVSLCGFSQTYYVSTTGDDATGDGSIGNPWKDPEFAALQLVAGDVLYIRGGTYYGVNNNHYGAEYDDVELMYIYGSNGSLHSGTALNPITMMNYNNEVVIFDGSNIEGAWTRNYGIFLNECDYWIIKGINVTNMIHQGYDDEPQKYCPVGIYLYETQNCTIEECNVYSTEGRGIDLQMDLGVGNRLSTGNLILNCDAYDNHDLHTKNGDGTPNPGGNGDGFGATMMTVGTTNTFRGCRSWFNGDDGYDNIVNGGSVYIDSCWAWLNGREDGNGEGFKLGNINAINSPDPATTYRWVTNSVAIYNSSDGFAGNGLEGIAILYNNIAMYNTGKGFNWDGCRNVATVMRNNISDGHTYDVQIYNNFVEDHNSWNMSPNYSYTADSVMIYRTDITAADQFESLDSTGISGARTDGVLPVLDFLKLKETSVYINAGTDVGIDYIGDNPDLGPFEYDAEEDPPATTPLVGTSDPTNIYSIKCLSAGVVTSDGGATVTQRGICISTSANPTTSDSKFMSGTGEGSFTVNITSLSRGTTYHVRAYAINSEGTAYGSDMSFTTPKSSIYKSSAFIKYNGKNLR